MLHPFGTTGHLPPGIHPCTLESLAAIVCFNPHRKRMWSQLLTFLVWPLNSGDFSYAYVAGEYVSAKHLPRSIDLVLETAMPYGPEAFEAITPFFWKGLEQIKQAHGIQLHFWIEDAPAEVFSSQTFRGAQPREHDHSQRLPSGQGIVRLDLSDSRISRVLEVYGIENSMTTASRY